MKIRFDQRENSHRETEVSGVLQENLWCHDLWTHSYLVWSALILNTRIHNCPCIERFNTQSQQQAIRSSVSRSQPSLRNCEPSYVVVRVRNPWHPNILPSIRQMECEIVQMTLNLFNTKEENSGVLTSGGTEACCYRLWHTGSREGQKE